MVDVPDVPTAPRRKPLLPLVALGLLLAAWGSSCLGGYAASQLDLSRFGRCEEVFEALARDGYVARFQLPFLTAAVLLDGLAVVALWAAGMAGQFRVLGGLVAVLCVPTVLWHGLGWLVLAVFAT
jgi:hypothetical protein